VRQGGERDSLVSRDNDMPVWIEGAWAMRLAIGGALAMLFVYLHLEMNRTFGYYYAPVKLPLLTFLWLAMCGVLLHQYLADGARWLLGMLVVFVVAVVMKVLFIDLVSWDLDFHAIYLGDYSPRDAALRLFDFAGVVGFLAMGCMLLCRRDDARSAGAFLGFSGLALLFIYATLEVNTFLHHYLPGMRSGGVSILWSIFALTLITRGVRANVRPVRYLGLALFAIVAWKVFSVDLAQLDQLYRIVAFIVLGIVVLAGSLVYLKYRDAFAIDSKPEETEPPP
jgi:uncharacterized membrane protein